MPMNPDLNSEDLTPDLSGNGLWQKLPRESANAYAAFTAFLESTPRPSLQKVASKLGVSYGSVAMLSHRFQWTERAAAWRQHVSQSVLASLQHTAVKKELWGLRQQVSREQVWE